MRCPILLIHAAGFAVQFTLYYNCIYPEVSFVLKCMLLLQFLKFNTSDQVSENWNDRTNLCYSLHSLPVYLLFAVIGKHGVFAFRINA